VSGGATTLARPLEAFYGGKTVLVTGHTGFKGSWLATWLTHLGARVVGYALPPPTEPSHFEACRLATRVVHVDGDVRDYEALERACREHRPEIVLHLAAQSLVRRAFAEPRLTFEVNLMGTVNVLEAARRTESVAAVVAVTSDKCYRNVGWEWGYREADPLGGHEAYGASKACAEIAAEAYRDPRFQRASAPGRSLPIASARAGNLLGGGDWAADRVVPDTVRAITAGTDLVLRSPEAVRPWQHVLESLSGYLWLGVLLASDGARYGAPWNFGPEKGPELTVVQVVQGLLERWPAPATRIRVERDESGAEAARLRLDSSRASHHLGWGPSWEIGRALDATVEWYRRFYDDPRGDAMYAHSVEQVEAYTAAAGARGLRWAGGAGPARAAVRPPEGGPTRRRGQAR